MSAEAIHSWLPALEKVGARLIRREDPGYPALLREIHDPPEALAVLGALDASDARSVAIVGSRYPSDYGVEVAERLGREFAEVGITVVSGMAIGIDGAAHRGALSAGGRTIAVLGSGIDYIHPASHRGLARKIAAHGAVISEFAPGTPPYPANFPQRNRIVAGLVRAAIIVEAGEKSGSLITARLANEEGRDVYAVPGEAGRDLTRGTHRLLREGAALLESALDVLEGTFHQFLERPSPETRYAQRIEALGSEEQHLIDCFDRSTVPLDRLIAKSGLGAGRVLEILLALEVGGFVRRHAGPAYSLAK